MKHCPIKAELSVNRYVVASIFLFTATHQDVVRSEIKPH